LNQTMAQLDSLQTLFINEKSELTQNMKDYHKMLQDEIETTNASTAKLKSDTSEATEKFEITRLNLMTDLDQINHDHAALAKDSLELRRIAAFLRARVSSEIGASKGKIASLRQEVSSLSLRQQEKKKDLYYRFGELELSEKELNAQKMALINIERKLRIRAGPSLTVQT